MITRPVVYPAPVANVLKLGVALVLIASALVAIAGCVPAPAIKQTQSKVTLNRAHEGDEALPQQAREIAQDNADAWEVQRYLLTGQALSPEAEARVGGAQ